MKLDTLNNEERIADFLKNSGLSLSENDLKAAVKALKSSCVISAPVKLGDFLYKVYDYSGLAPRIQRLEVLGIMHTKDKRIIVNFLFDSGGLGWYDLEECFYTYEEAKEFQKKLLNESKRNAESYRRRHDLLESGKRDMVDTLSQRLKQNNFAGLSSEAIKILSSAIVSNGMIVAPVNIGDTVYQVFENDEESWIEESTVRSILFDGDWMIAVDDEEFENLDKYILTYEEAERVLNECLNEEIKARPQAQNECRSKENSIDGMFDMLPW